VKIAKGRSLKGNKPVRYFFQNHLNPHSYGEILAGSLQG
jgi:hypothetical protein